MRILLVSLVVFLLVDLLVVGFDNPEIIWADTIILLVFLVVSLSIDLLVARLDDLEII